mgnify:CR=1 FL=1|tara:strand:- start:31712 stop:32551 length:840 start_codon:yes stop_codon:yes gene_type:complete
MRFHNAIILVASILAPTHLVALERLGDGEEPVLDFRNGAPVASVRSDKAQSISKPSVSGRRLGATTHLSLGGSTSTRSEQEDYSVRDIAGHSFFISARLFDYFSVSASKGRSGSTVEYEQLRLNGPYWSNEYYTFDAERDLENSSASAGLRADFLGMASSSPYVAVSRSRIKQHSDLTIIGKRYNYSSSVPLETVQTKVDEGDFSEYVTTWSLGYESMLGSAASVSGGFSHSLNDDRHSRSFGLAVSIWLSRHLAVGVGVSRNHDAENNSGGIDLSLAL